MRTFIAPELSFDRDIYFHRFLALDEGIGEFGVYTNANETQTALEDIVLAIESDGTMDENADMYLTREQYEENRESNPDSAEYWIVMDGGDAIANSWNEAYECRRVEGSEALDAAFANEFMKPCIYEGDIYEYTNEYDDTVLTESEDEAFSNAENGEDVEVKHGFIAYLSADGYMDRTDAALYETWEEAAQELFDER